MNKFFPRIFLLAFVIWSAFLNKSYAQVSYGGTPPSFHLTKSATLRSPVLKSVTPTDDIQLLKKQDRYAKRNGQPPIVATLISSNLNMAKDGSWQVIDGDSVCQLSIQSRYAQGLILYYDNFFIPEGGRLFVYNKEKSQVLGAYTTQTNPYGGNFSTEVVYGDYLTLEYVRPKGTELPKILISKIGYAYNLAETLFSKGTFMRTAESTSNDDCYIDVNCSEGTNWQQQKKGVARIFVPIGTYTYMCSGSLVNNVYQDHTPYFLSAHHCFDENGQTANFAQIQFYFNYEATTCGSATVSPKLSTMVGADMLVDCPLVGGSDGTLLRLKDSIPASYDVYYNGWDISTTAPTSGVVIHHPNGIMKKISTYTTSPRSVTFTDGQDSSAINGHWQVTYSTTTNGYSVTAEGSSGSPLFNQDGRIVGTLTGGLSFCDTPTQPDWFGKFYYHYNHSSDSTQWMSKYLNSPGYTTVTKINGIDGYTKGDTIVGENFIQISPTFVDNYLYVTSSYAIRQIRVYSLNGRLMYRSSTTPINTTNWARGIYLVSVITNEGVKGRAKIYKR